MILTAQSALVLELIRLSSMMPPGVDNQDMVRVKGSVAARNEPPATLSATKLIAISFQEDFPAVAAHKPPPSPVHWSGIGHGVSTSRGGKVP